MWTPINTYLKNTQGKNLFQIIKDFKSDFGDGL